MTVAEKIQPSPLLWSAHPIHIPAFFGALFLAPVVIGIIGIPFFFISLAAVVFGAPVYFGLGAPIMFWLLSRGIRNAGTFALAGFLVNLAVCLCGYAISYDEPEVANLYLVFGSVFAPIWAVTFVAFYHDFTKNSRIYA